MRRMHISHGFNNPLDPTEVRVYAEGTVIWEHNFPAGTPIAIIKHFCRMQYQIHHCTELTGNSPYVHHD